MEIRNIPFNVFNWKSAEASEHKGDTGTSFWRAIESGGIRVRTVQYTPGFRSDHYCPRGHVLLVLQGEVGIHLRDGRTFSLGEGSGFVAGDDEANPHSVVSERGATVFIVD